MAARNGITISEMFNEETFERKLRALASGYKKRYGDLLEYDVEEGMLGCLSSRFETSGFH